MENSFQAPQSKRGSVGSTCQGQSRVQPLKNSFIEQVISQNMGRQRVHPRAASLAQEITEQEKRIKLQMRSFEERLSRPVEALQEEDWACDMEESQVLRQALLAMNTLLHAEY
jgi:hypothetical protein